MNRQQPKMHSNNAIQSTLDELCCFCNIIDNSFINKSEITSTRILIYPSSLTL